MSRKEEQRRRRAAKQEAARRRDNMRRVFTMAAVVVLVPLALYVFWQGLFPDAPVMPPAEVSPRDQVRGAEDADLVLTVYADFQCPACRIESQVIGRAWPRLAERVRQVYRHFPLDTHRHAFLAARYAEAAGEQGQFWEMHDLLFANQAAWSSLPDAASAFSGFAEQLGLDMEQLREDLNDSAVRDKILADQRSGLRAGVRGTPTLFLNGRMINNPRTAADLIRLVDEASGGAD